MFDDLRNEAIFIDEEKPPEPEPGDKKSVQKKKKRAEPRSKFLGMTAPQRFVISIFIFMMVCLVGTFAMVLFEKMYLPF